MEYNGTKMRINYIEDQEQNFISDCRQRNDWPKLKDVIEAKLDSLAKQSFLDLFIHLKV